MDEYRAEVFPEEKARFVEDAQQNGHTVIMLGDGINDGAAIAREIADVTISADSLYELVVLRRLATPLMGCIINTVL